MEKNNQTEKFELIKCNEKCFEWYSIGSYMGECKILKRITTCGSICECGLIRPHN